MVRLLDARSGAYAEVTPTRSGLLRVCAHIPATADVADLTGLRVALVADLLFRAAELRNLQVLTVLAFPGQSPAQPVARPTEREERLRQAADAISIHPPVEYADLSKVHAPADVHITTEDPDGSTAPADPTGSAGLITRVGAATVRRPGDHDAAADLLAGAADPLAFRLALMTFPQHQPADLTKDVLADADEMIARWRNRVALWAESPSKPMPAQIAATARSAFADLDTAAAICLLRDLTLDTDVPPGAKFETFVYADRVLGLDLPRDIGRI